MNQDKMRREFENWANNGYLLVRQDHFPDLYRAMQTQRAWEAWQAARRHEWQPIETAPRDGTEIWVIDNDSQMAASFERYEIESSLETSGYWMEVRECMQIEPTHWMPLPTPPTQDKP